MRIEVQVRSAITETEVNVLCQQVDTEVDTIVTTLRLLDQKLTGENNGQTVIVEAAGILYIDTVDKKTFLYTDRNVYQTPLKLYELEDRLATLDFMRIGKSAIVNFNHIQAIQADINERLIITLDNGEKLIVSRMYTDAIKKKLGVRA